MKRVPVIFAIDKNVVTPCGVTITSLLLNAGEDKFYDVFILCDGSHLGPEDRKVLTDAFKGSEKCSLSFVDVGDAFKDVDGMTSGHITTATYYRLEIPTLFPQYDKVIYADIDMIFQQDLSALFESALPDGELVAAVLDLSIDGKFQFRSPLPAKIGKSGKDYFNAGFLVMNLKQMREEGVVEAFREHAKIKYTQNDQDILNIVCNGRVQILPSLYNFQVNHFFNYMWNRKDPKLVFEEQFRKATLHYTWKNKPWNSLECIACDTWWHYYKMSPFYDDRSYFSRQLSQVEAVRNDYRSRTNKQLFLAILSNIKQKLFKK